MLHSCCPLPWKACPWWCTWSGTHQQSPRHPSGTSGSWHCLGQGKHKQRLWVWGGIKTWYFRQIFGVLSFFQIYFSALSCWASEIFPGIHWVSLLPSWEDCRSISSMENQADVHQLSQSGESSALMSLPAPSIVLWIQDSMSSILLFSFWQQHEFPHRLSLDYPREHNLLPGNSAL